MKVSLYSLPGSVCPGCRATKRKFEQLGISYTEFRLDVDPAAVATVKELGYVSAPVVVVDFGDGATASWSGFKPSQIELIGK